MKLVGQETRGETIRVRLEGKKPSRLIWKGRPYRVQSVDETWRADGYWWLDENIVGISRRHYLLTIASPNRTTLCVEIYYQRPLWKIVRVSD